MSKNGGQQRCAARNYTLNTSDLIYLLLAQGLDTNPLASHDIGLLTHEFNLTFQQATVMSGDPSAV
jgi:hypothetical protein